MPEPGASGRYGRDSRRPAGDREPFQILIDELQQLLATMNRLIGVMEGLATRPLVHMEVAHQDVDQLDFHVGNIDVQGLSGELNLGITHKVEVLKGEAPEERGPAAGPDTTAVAAGAAVAGRPRTLPRSVVTRWREQGKGEQAHPGTPQPVTSPPAAPPAAPSEVLHIWPPPSPREEEAV